jgi:GNAT superfamily N-acetyltransferase
MLKIYNIKDKQNYIREVAELTQKEWGSRTNSDEEFNNKIENKVNKILINLSNHNYCKLILLKDEILVGFISIFPHDCDERPDLSPWYATMYVKKEFRGNGYSKLLNDSILTEAKNRGFTKIYLKTSLVNYYEKFGANYIETLKTGEKLYCFDL